MPEKTQDKNLFQKMQQGDEQAFRAIFDRFYQRLLAIAINLMHDLHTAKDVVQEVFLQIWRTRANITTPNNVEAYLKRAVINRSLNMLKAKKRYTGLPVEHDQPSSQPSATDQLVGQELQAVIQTALASLPERCRLVYVMKRMEGKSLKEIAATLDISPKTAENQITKALKVLKEAVKPYMDKQ